MFGAECSMKVKDVGDFTMEKGFRKARREEGIYLRGAKAISIWDGKRKPVIKE